MVTLTWHASKYKVHKLHQRYILIQASVYNILAPTTVVTGYIVARMSR